MALVLVFLIISLGLLTGPSADGQAIQTTTTADEYLYKMVEACATTPNINGTDGTTESTTETEEVSLTPRQESNNCTCVFLHECKKKDFDLKILDESCGNYLETCCEPENIIYQTPPVTSEPNPLNPRPGRCGIRNFHGLGFNATGSVNAAQYGEFPWMVAVMRQDPSVTSNSTYQCGGSLIHPQVVLTVAHCVNGRSGLFIRAGEWDRETENEDYKTQDQKVRKVIIHDQYNNETAENGVALLILEEPVNMTAMNVGRICLPEYNESMEGRRCVATGWGKDVFGKEGKYQGILKKVDLPIVPRGICQESLRQTRLNKNFTLHESFICAGGFTLKDTCTGDGGSPLVCASTTNPYIFVQAGVVSWGIGCGSETPAVYVSVPHFVNWIRDKAEAEGFPIDV